MITQEKCNPATASLQKGVLSIHFLNPFSFWMPSSFASMSIMCGSLEHPWFETSIFQIGCQYFMMMSDLFEVKNEDFYQKICIFVSLCSAEHNCHCLPSFFFKTDKRNRETVSRSKPFLLFGGCWRRATCGVACGVARRRHPKVTAAPYAAPPHVGAQFSALPHALLVLVHTLANFEFYT
jgi:hypothetical protein